MESHRASNWPLCAARHPPGQDTTKSEGIGPPKSRGQKRKRNSRIQNFRFRRFRAPSRRLRDSLSRRGPSRRAPQTWPLAPCIPDGRRPLAEGGREGPRRQETDGGGRGSPAPPRLAGGADREWALRGVVLGGRRQDPLPYPLEARGPAGLPGAAGRGALQGARACAPPKKNIPRKQQEPPGEVTELACGTDQDDSRSTTEDKDTKQAPRQTQQGSLPPAARLPAPLADHRYQAQDPTHHWSPLLSEDFSNPDCWLHVRLFYRGKLVLETTTRVAEGCRLSPQEVTAAEGLLGPPRCMAQVCFPEPPPGARVLERLLRHLERGVLLWVAPEGVFAKRLCRGRVYWRGPLAPHRAQPNKLEREHTCQLLDTLLFLEGRSPGARVPNPSVLW
ncbi:interferon regulatory factor 8 isoform X3 [Mustela putorius furo]|uniref:Interferon regulatory factor 8 isoform X3 n=1 Tax=Mustela putorius furo TaxID=9669 RepID=A0A8U0NQG7_MUSPF|nr:interferon regulatory factor 8 isoform X3 [Mustela putorius furo]